MTLPTGPERDFEHAKLLLEEYSFDLAGFKAGELVAIWQEIIEADPSWIRAAVLEALYQGRYKAYSVEQILQTWKRRGHPLRHFNSDFERVVFGPIDPTFSKYAPLSTRSPSEMMTVTPPAQEDLAGMAAAAPSTDVTAAPDLPATPAASVPGTVTAADPAGAPAETAVTAPERWPEVAAAEVDAPAPTGSPRSPLAEAQLPLFHHPQPIRKFTPPPEASEFYHRLQSVARHAD